MRSLAVRLVGLAVVAGVIVASSAPEAGAKPPNLTGCKGECRKTEIECGGECIKVDAQCSRECGCVNAPHTCTEPQKTCLAQCVLRLEGCHRACKNAHEKCVAKC